MSLQKFLEADEEQLMQALGSADSAEQCVPILERETDRLLYLYNENTADDTLQSAAAGLMRQIHTGAALINTGGETSVYVSAESKTGKKEKTASRVLLTAGMICMAAVLICSLIPFGILSFPGKLAVTVPGMTAGSAFFFLSGKKRSFAPSSENNKTFLTRTKPDAARIYRIYRALILTADRTLAGENDRLRLEEHRIAKEKEESGALYAGRWSEKDLSLMGELLEASYSRDGEYALDKLNQLKFRLHQEGIETVDYSPENENWFDRLPSSQSTTIRPALVFNGQLLKKGLAGTAS
jgi:hypothetical protein